MACASSVRLQQLMAAPNRFITVSGIGLVGMHDGGAIRCGHAGEVIRLVIVEGEVLKKATMGFHKTIGIVIEETPVGGVPAFLGDAIDGVRGALVVIAPGLPGMVDG